MSNETQRCSNWCSPVPSRPLQDAPIFAPSRDQSSNGDAQIAASHKFFAAVALRPLGFPQWQPVPAAHRATAHHVSACTGCLLPSDLESRNGRCGELSGRPRIKVFDPPFFCLSCSTSPEPLPQTDNSITTTNMLPAKPSPAEVAFEIKALGVHPNRMGIAAPALLPICVICACLRFYVRGRMMKAFALDDWMLLIALLIVAGECMYLAEQIFLKASLGIYFMRIVSKKWEKRTIAGLLTVYEMYTFAFLFYGIFQYGAPTAKDILLQWKAPHALPEATSAPLNYLYAALNILVDFVFTIIPIVVVAKAMMPRRAKISVSILILLGSVGSVVSVARIYYLPVIFKTFTFSGIEILGVISLAESAAGIIAISLAACRPLFKSFFEKTSSKGSKSNTAHKSTGAGFTGISRRTDVDIVRGDVDEEAGVEEVEAGPELSEKGGISHVQVVSM
ncbi:hypothetical protein ANO11243_094700 [Dothideomycetidae sp. 11243]|nr:hypothetical protein ANO11243_094700 [fungal sp. No.11243]